MGCLTATSNLVKNLSPDFKYSKNFFQILKKFSGSSATSTSNDVTSDSSFVIFSHSGHHCAALGSWLSLENNCPQDEGSSEDHVLVQVRRS